MAIVEKYFFFPFKTPEHYQIVAILLGFLYLFVSNPIIKIILIAVILVLDWYDGAAARKFKTGKDTGWISDVFIDRLSEAQIFFAEIFNPVGRIFFVLYLVNIFLSFYSLKTGKHILLPIRFIYILVLAMQL